MVTIIMRTHNGSKTIERAIDSVIAQDHRKWELIIIDDASNDGTVDIVRQYHDERIRLIRHERNKGAAAALNTGLDNASGEWFTSLDDDDEMIVPDALSTMLRVPSLVDDKINAVTCNCKDAITGRMTGRGLDHDQYLDARTIMQKVRGEHWGLTKTALLGKDRLNEEMPGMESTLWHRINKRANRYYIHKALRIYHTEAQDRLCLMDVSDERSYRGAIAMMDEKEFLADYRRWGTDEYLSTMYTAGLAFMCHGDRARALKVLPRLLTCRRGWFKGMALVPGILFGPKVKSFLGRIKHRYV